MQLVRLPLAAALAAVAVGSLGYTSPGYAQPAPFDRLPHERLAVMPPTERVLGEPGAFSVRQQPCLPVPDRDLRRHIVDIVVQEWAYFGFSMLDETDPEAWLRLRRAGRNAGANGVDAATLRAQAEARAEEAARVASSIAGYWAATREGAWIIGRQNEAWNVSNGTASRWVEPWSAAFISWVMCEAGLDDDRFRRAIAHHVYIDQAIRARDGQAPDAAFAAYDVGEQPVVPGDMLCAARRPAYRNLAQRRSQMGVGARTHCDIVVKVDEAQERFLAIGGNVRGTVGLKLLPAERTRQGWLRPLDRGASPGPRAAFAHLKLSADPIDPAAFYGSPTMTALQCAHDGQPAEDFGAFGAASVLIAGGAVPSAETAC